MMGTMAKSAKRSKKQPVRILSSKVVFRGPVFQVTSDQVREPGGVKVRRDIVRHAGSVVILASEEGPSSSSPKLSSRRDSACNGDPRVLLARQYRYAANDWLWELPAGRIDEGEDELPAAKRELLEETGFTAKSWRRSLFFYSSPGFLDETMVVYLARGLTPGKAQPEEDEFISKRFFPISQAVRMVMRGSVRDAKTIAALLWFQQHRQQRR